MGLLFDPLKIWFLVFLQNLFYVMLFLINIFINLASFRLRLFLILLAMYLAVGNLVTLAVETSLEALAVLRHLMQVLVMILMQKIDLLFLNLLRMLVGSMLRA